MKIIQLHAENVKRLKAVEIMPEGNVVIVGGRNAQGKSSVLDAIEYALAGNRSIPDVPIRSGQKKAKIVVNLDGEPPITVTRTFTANGSQLVVTTEDGNKVSSPQALLDKLCGAIAFDPLEFTRMKPDEQTKTLRAIVGLDFSALDAEAERVYQERTAVNREQRQLAARLQAMPQHRGAPAEEVSVAELMAELKRRQEINRHNDAERRSLGTLAREIDQADAEIAELQEELARLQALLNDKTRQAEELRQKHSTMCARVDALEDANWPEIERQIEESEQVNAAVRANRGRAALVKAHAALCGKSAGMTERLEEIQDEKQRRLTEAAWPVPGLGFDEHGVTFGGIPFNQASSAEQLRVSVAIGLALNPELRVLLIRDGSLLDSDSLAMLAQLAAENEAQLWVERVGEDGPVSVVIEDGEIKE